MKERIILFILIILSFTNLFCQPIPEIEIPEIIKPYLVNPQSYAHDMDIEKDKFTIFDFLAYSEFIEGIEIKYRNQLEKSGIKITEFTEKDIDDKIKNFANMIDIYLEHNKSKKYYCNNISFKYEVGIYNFVNKFFPIKISINIKKLPNQGIYFLNRKGNFDIGSLELRFESNKVIEINMKIDIETARKFREAYPRYSSYFIYNEKLYLDIQKSISGGAGNNKYFLIKLFPIVNTDLEKQIIDYVKNDLSNQFIKYSDNDEEKKALNHKTTLLSVFKNEALYLYDQEQSYYDFKDSILDVKPEPIGGWESIKVIYPELAKRVGVKGQVKIKIYLNEAGEIDKLQILQGIGAGCDEAVIEAVKNTKFKPGKIGSRFVKTKIVLPYKFNLS